MGVITRCPCCGSTDKEIGLIPYNDKGDTCFHCNNCGGYECAGDYEFWKVLTYKFRNLWTQLLGNFS